MERSAVTSLAAVGWPFGQLTASKVLKILILVREKGGQANRSAQTDFATLQRLVEKNNFIYSNIADQLNR